MNKKEPVHFLTYETDEEEDYEDFDPFLYSKLLDARDVMIEIFTGQREKAESASSSYSGDCT